MKVSVVIICWNDREDITRCIDSVLKETRAFEYEVIVTDNGSTDGSIEEVRGRFPTVVLIENKKNLGFGGANNRGFAKATGEYVLILNPDTIIHDRAIEKLVEYADRKPKVGGVGCRVLNADGSIQRSAHPPLTVRSYLIAALYLRFLGHVSSAFTGDMYMDWDSNVEREIGFQAGCCLLVRGKLLKALKGFDERLFFQTEDADLCLRIAKAEYSVVYYPGAHITHIGGQNRGRYPLPVVLETQRSFYRFFYKHYRLAGARKLRRVLLVRNIIRLVGYASLSVFRRSPKIESRLTMHRALLRWHWLIDPAKFIKDGEEPKSEFKPFAPPPNMAEPAA